MIAKFVNETINFERGNDPKKSMDIGMSYSDRQFIENTNWGMDPLTEDYKVIELIRSYKGIPILIIQFITGEKDNYLSNKYIAVTDNEWLRSHWEESKEEALEMVMTKIGRRIQNSEIRKNKSSQKTIS